MISNIDKALLLLLVFCIIIILVLTNYPNEELMTNIAPINKWTRSANCRDYMNKTTYDVLSDNNIEYVDENRADEAQIVFPCGYNAIDHEIRSLPHLTNSERQPKIVFIVDGADEISAKNLLWKNLLKHYGLEQAKIYSPNTYLLIGSDKTQDLKRLKADHTLGKMYILKKNLQRQLGLEITDSLEKIEQNKGDYVLAQELLLNSYLVNKRKINIRVYVVVVSHRNNIKIYVYNDGFISYTKKHFEPSDKSNDNHVTTGYVDRKVYVHNPLTHGDFKQYLDLPAGDKYHPSLESRILSDVEQKIISQGHRISDVVFKRIDELIQNVFISFKGVICRNAYPNGTNIPIYGDYGVQIFGADVAINDNLQPQIMEINKGPDLVPKDDREAMIKKGLVQSIMDRMGLGNKNMQNDLRLVLEFN